MQQNNKAYNQTEFKREREIAVCVYISPQTTE